MQLNYKAILPINKFKEWNCNRFPDDKSCGNFMHEFEMRNLEKPLELNVLERAIFETNRNLYDIYSLSLYLHISRGFLISDRLFNIFKEYTLSNYSVFNNIKVSIKGDLTYLKFIYFYTDFSKRIEYNKSTFQTVTDEFYLARHKGINPEMFIRDPEIKINSIIEFEERYIKFKKKENLILLPKILYISDATNFDIISMYENFTSGILFSTRLQERLHREKIRGLDYWENVYFRIEG